MPGVLKQIGGPLYYVIEVDNGVQWKWHMDYILPAGSSPHSKDTIPGEELKKSDWFDFTTPQDLTAPEVTPGSIPEVTLEDTLPGVLYS